MDNRTVNVPSHGKGGYSKGCRCDECRTGQREHQRIYNARLKAGKVGRTCEREGCDQPHRARGLCSTHYNESIPKDVRHAKVETPCFVCGETVVKYKSARRSVCSEECKYVLAWGMPREQKQADMEKRAQDKAAARAPYDPRSPLRIAYDEGNSQAFIEAVRAGSTINELGCWIWGKKLSKDGYPTTRLAGKQISVHRAVLEAKYDAPLGSQHAHHICAETRCVNPDHLQPVTHRDNIAEMLARHSYLNRIADLEAALAEVAPTHPLLSVIEVA